MTINIHTPQTVKKHGSDFYYFLAGLIDGDVYFSFLIQKSKIHRHNSAYFPELVVCFFEKDVHVAYFLKKQIQYGIVSKVKHKKAYTFVLCHSKGLEKVCLNIHNKLLHTQKIIQYNTRLNKLENFKETEKKDFKLPANSWFTGFFVSAGCFEIKVIYTKNRKLPEIRLNIQIHQKDRYLLEKIQKQFGGCIGFRKLTNTYYYSSVNYMYAKKIIEYFDVHHLMGVKMTQYVLWRKVYLKIIEKSHLNAIGVKYIINVKSRMNNLNK